MKTIQPGITNKERKPAIWEGLNFTCSKCNGKFELVHGDIVLIISQERRPGGKVTVHTPPCPTVDCGHINEVSFYPNSTLTGTSTFGAR